jgi:L-fucose isomerase
VKVGKMRPKVGLITTLAPGESWPKTIVELAASDLVKAREALQRLEMDVFDVGKIARTNEEMKKQAEVLRTNGVEVLVIFVSNWAYSNAAVSAALTCGVPVIVWANARLGSAGITGGSIIKGAFDEIGIPSTLIYGDFTDKKTLDELKICCTAAAAVTRLRGQTCGLAGGRSMGMYTAVVDPIQWRSVFGVDIDSFEQFEILERAKKVSDNDAIKFLEWMKKEFGRIEQRDEIMLMQIKLYLALKEIVKEKGYDFIAVKCLPEMPSHYTTFCLAHAIFNDRSDAYGEKESFVFACEADLNGALTMEIMKEITGGPVLFADVSHIDIDENIVRLSNCGSHPTDLAESKKDVYWVKDGLREFTWKYGGTCPQFVAKAGKVTLARLSRVQGEYIMLITTGAALKFPREKLSEINPNHPQVFVKLDCNVNNFIKCLRANHIHLVYGDYSAHLREVCRILNIKSVIP